MQGAVLKNLLKGGVDDAANLSYRRANKELRGAIDHRIMERNPDRMYQDMLDEAEGAIMSEGGGTDIPRIHVDDLKEFGYETEIPTRYKRRTGRRDIDELAGFAGFTEAGGDRGIDGFLEQIMSTLNSRKEARNRAMDLVDQRNDPEFIRETMKILEDEKAMFAPPPEPYQPSKRDLDWYMKNVQIPKSRVHQIPVSAPQQEGMRNFRINRNDVSPVAHDPTIRVDYQPSQMQIPVRGAQPHVQPPVQMPIQPPMPQPSMIQSRGIQTAPAEQSGMLINPLMLQMTREY